MPTLEDLSTDLRRSDQEYVDYVSTLDLDQLAERIDFAFTDGVRGPGVGERAACLWSVVSCEVRSGPA